MKVLQISNKSPWPPCEGGPIAMHSLTEGLEREGHTVHVLTMSTHKFTVNRSDIPKEYLERTEYVAVEVDTRVKAVPAFVNLFAGGSYNIERFITPAFENELKAKLDRHSYDVVILESLFVTPYIEVIRARSKAKIILRAHNVEHKIWERLTKACSNPFTALYLRLLTKRLLRYELSVIPTIDGIAAITDKDAAFFRDNAGDAKVAVVPFGIDPSNYIFTPQDGRHISLCHIGSMDWMPNIEGIRWFLEKCWPGIQQVFPDLKLYLAGRNMPSWLTEKLFPNVVIVGEVEDAHAFMTNHPIMVVPLLSGSGVRVKIIEAMALGRTVLTTTIGAEGIRYAKGQDLLIADSPVAFFEQIKTCLKDPVHVAGIGAAARSVIERNHNATIATKAILDLIGSL